MAVRRTVQVALEVDSDDAALLVDTVDVFLWSAQYVVGHAFDGESVTTARPRWTTTRTTMGAKRQMGSTVAWCKPLGTRPLTPAKASLPAGR